MPVRTLKKKDQTPSSTTPILGHTELEQLWQKEVDAAAESASPLGSKNIALVSIGDKKNCPVDAPTFPVLRKSVETLFPFEAFKCFWRQQQRHKQRSQLQPEALSA